MKPSRYRKIPCQLVLCILSLVSAVPQTRGDALDTLQWRNPYPTGNDFAGVAFGGGQFVALDSAGYVLTTADGVSWMNRGPSTVKSPRTVNYLGGKFVVTGEAGEIATSVDTISWTARASGTTQTLVSVTYGNGTFVAVGTGATILSSPDGLTWTSRVNDLNPAYGFVGVAFGSGRFVAANGVGIPYTSEDGSVWTQRPVSGMLQHVSIAVGNDRFVVDAWYRFGPGSSYPVPWTSTNGLDWVRASSAPAIGSKIFFGGVFFTLGIGISKSADGVAMTPGNLPGDVSIVGLAYGNGNYFGVGRGKVAKSSDGLNWTVIPNAGDYSMTISSATYGADKYVFFGSGSIFTSTDGVSYQRVTDPAALSGGVSRYIGGKFVSLGAGTIAHSEDALSWTRVRSGTLKTLRGQAYGAGRWVTVGDAGEIRVSEDLRLWQGLWSGTDYPLNSVVYAQGKFVAVGYLGIIYSSPDGLIWTQQTNDDLGTLRGILYGNGKFVAYGDSLLTSTDGVTWARRSLPAGINRITFGGDTFVATGSSDRTVQTSADGINWETKNVPTSGVVEFLNGAYFLFGANGAILQSTPVGATVLSAASASGSFEVTITGTQVGTTYRLQSCTDLAADIWADVTTFVATQSITVIPVPGGVGAPLCYYRAVTAP